ncbi:DUF4255 domain-containing protein [Aquimarina pacifica]|uniref:DUF4255 domain-containing protein n=1 Tax=Aquimarina pacifica TaxID=1296415 RepID=UPI00046F68DF|nr:DUF4255 domain-containing protein [Aquimarina pacifica]
MIFQVLQIVKEEVNSYFEDTTVALGNIANASTGDGEDDEDSDVILSLLNIDEEPTLKNIPNYSIEGNTVSYKNPKVNVNLYVIFSANNQLYVESLKSISKVIEFFQGKNVFTHVNSNFNRDDADMQEIGNFKFITELYTPSFEQLSYIWGILGGKQYPSVIYKIRLLEIERDVTTVQGAIITEIGATLNKI